MWHPMKYASMLAEKMERHGTRAWLVNTGWAGGRYGVGARIKLRYTRAILDAIHSGELENVETDVTPVFGLHVPKACPGVPETLLDPSSSWTDKEDFGSTLKHLGSIYSANFERYADGGGFVARELAEAILAAGPDVGGAGASNGNGKAANGY